MTTPETTTEDVPAAEPVAQPVADTREAELTVVAETADEDAGQDPEEDQPQPDELGDDELDEPADHGEAEDEPGPPDADETGEATFAAVVRPEVVVRWPAGVVEPLARLSPTAVAGPIAALDGLADTLGLMFPEAGAGGLLPDGVRWSPVHGWQLLLTPPYDTTGEHYVAAGPFDEPTFGIAWRRDQQSVAIALTEAAFGRRPTGPAEIRRLADLNAGRLPHGFDAVVNLLLRDQVRPGDTTPLRYLAEALGRVRAGRLTGRCYLETAVGSAKAKGRGVLDNEDVAASSVGVDGVIRLGLFDGATGDGDGSGRTAALAACARIEQCWDAPGAAPGELLTEADAAVCEASDGCSTAVLAIIEPAGRARLGSLGDSSAWLIRPGLRDTFHTWRLTPAQTVFADAVRASADGTGGYSELTGFLGGGAAEPFVTEFTVCDGDLLVFLSDGAAVAQRSEWFGDALRGLAVERTGADRPLGAALAAELVARAERCGGFDNATVLVSEFAAA